MLEVTWNVLEGSGRFSLRCSLRGLRTQTSAGARKVTEVQRCPFPQRNTPSPMFWKMHGPFFPLLDRHGTQRDISLLRAKWPRSRSFILPRCRCEHSEPGSHILSKTQIVQLFPGASGSVGVNAMATRFLIF